MESIKNLKIVMEEKILASHQVAIVPHNGIDFDAIGSAIGLSYLTKKLKKPSCIVVNDPLYKIDHGVQLIMDEARKNFSFLNLEKYLQTRTSEDLLILTDVNKTGLISLKEELPDKENILILDHHNSDSTTVDAHMQYIDVDVSSASEIVAKLLSLFKVKCSSDVANYLLAGIYLDTNRLTKNISSDTMNIIAKLLENGANINQVTDWFIEDYNSDRRVQELVGKANFFTYSIAVVEADENTEYTKEELAKVADYLLKFSTDAAFAIGNIGDHIISISARSKEKVDVGLIMQELNGGGHARSGATKLGDCSIAEASKRLMKILQPPCYRS